MAIVDKGCYLEFYTPNSLDVWKEEKHQIDGVAWIKYNHPTLLFFHPVNENKKTIHTALKDSQSGLLKGVSDFIFLIGVNGYPFAAIELKRTNKSGKAKASPVSKEQKEFLRDVRSRGGFAAVAYGFEELKKAVEYMLNSTNC